MGTSMFARVGERGGGIGGGIELRGPPFRGAVRWVSVVVMGGDEREQLELQVIVDVLNVVEARLCEHERRGWRLTVPRTRIYAAVLHAVILSARATRVFPATLDRADILDAILDGAEPPEDSGQPVEDAICAHLVNLN
ncbi:hypothetical protein [Nocardia sp. NPDC050406]|uniref:hypothetical protein n=1 Tax=Nocardia sp. NPDC050406 TaxID=3364318 RepID=UPI0037A3A07A